ncbi:MAG: BBP7 family outer membrane beta-barrel protein, partial [Planctomycetia bacterium]|nr:BBP7 family outer membrane beta-barrel protein [Planctomycetia bacterium]
MRTVFAVIAFAIVTGPLVAQPSAAPPSAPATLLSGQAVSNTVPVGGGEVTSLPGGMEVSRPLTMVGPPEIELPVPEPITIPEAKAIAPERVRGPLGPAWDGLELLFWWPMRQPVPPIVFGTRSGAQPALGQRGTLLIIGGQSLDTEPSAGARFTLGYSVNSEQTAGFEVVYFFLGTRTFRENLSNVTGPIRSFGLPYTNAVTGRDEILALAQLGATHSFLSASTSVRVQGWEINGVANLHDGKHVKLNGLAGWRYFQVHEGLRLEQTQFRYVGMGGVVQT